MSNFAPGLIEKRQFERARRFKLVDGKWRETRRRKTVPKAAAAKASPRQQPKIGAGRKKMTAVPAGTYPLMAGEWRKVLRWMKTSVEGRSFLALPEPEQEVFFRKLVLTAHMRNDRTAYIPGLGKHSRRLYEAHIKRATECATRFPEVTAHAIKCFQKRIGNLNDLSSDFIQASLGYFSDETGKVISRNEHDKLPPDAIRAMSQLRIEHSARKKRKRGKI